MYFTTFSQNGLYNLDKAALAGHIGDCCCNVLPRLLKAGREYWQQQHEQHAGDS